MAKKETQAAEGAWTPRSQAAIERQRELELKRVQLQAAIKNLNGKIAEAERRKDAYAQRMDHFLVQRVLEELRAFNDELEVWEDQLAQVEKEIDGLQPSAESIARRAETQNALAAGAEERLALDTQIDEQLDRLRELLAQRAEATNRMASLANALELSYDLDQGRFDALLASLPAPMAAQSRHWLARLLGREQLPVRAFARERLVLQETLGHTGVYNIGDELALSQEQFSELHRSDRPAGFGEQGCLPPSVFTPDEYEAAQQLAKSQGVTLQEVIYWQDAQTRLQAEEDERARILGRNHKHRQLHYTPSRRVRANSRIGFGGKEYEAGQVFEIGPDQLEEVRSLAVAGAIEPVA